MSVISIINVSPATGVPERFVVNEVMACARPVIEATSVLSVLIVGVADCDVVTTLAVTLLFVKVFVEEIEGITTPSTEITPADARAIVVSEALPSSIEPTPIAVEVEATRPAIGNPVTFVRVPEEGVPKAPPEYKTVPPAPKATEELSVPVSVKVLLTVRVFPSAIVRVEPVAGAVIVTLFTVVGVIFPSVRVIAGVVVAVATLPETPFAVVTETEVTVPEPAAKSTFSLCVVGSAYKTTGVVPSIEDVPIKTGILLLSLGAEIFDIIV